MNRFVLFVALGLSLVGNAWFLFAAGPRTTDAAIANPSSPGATPAVAATASVSAAPPAAEKTTSASATAAQPDLRGTVWRAPGTDDEFRAFADDLRAAGFPPHVINRVVTDLYQQRRRGESPAAKLPFWQRRAAQKEMQEYDRATTKSLEAILGPDARPSARIDAVTRVRQYGNLADTKIDAIAAVERDYQDIQRDLARNQDGGFFSAEEWSARQQQRDLLKTEMRADLEKILTPAELADYELRNSDTARSLAHTVQSVTVNAAEFASLYEARRAFERANPSPTGRTTPEQFAARQSAELAYYEQARAILADDRFYSYLEAAQPDFRSLTALAKQYPSVTPVAAYQALQLRYEIQKARNTLPVEGPTNTLESIQATYASWNARLDALLGPDAAAAYRKTSYGRMFVGPTPRPSNRSTPPKG